MIQINLLPQEMRVKAPDPRKERYLLIAAGIGILFVLLTLVFYIDFLGASNRLKQIEKKWSQVEPAHRQLTELQKEVDEKMKPERLFMEQFVTTQQSATDLIEWASELLPEGAWLEELKLERKPDRMDFLLRGSCVSTKGKTSIEQIESYLQDYKQKLKSAKLILKTTRMQIGETEMTQFTANLNWVDTSGNG